MRKVSKSHRRKGVGHWANIETGHLQGENKGEATDKSLTGVGEESEQKEVGNGGKVGKRVCF